MQPIDTLISLFPAVLKADSLLTAHGSIQIDQPGIALTLHNPRHIVL